MERCQQTSTQSVLQHGLSVKEHVFQLIEYLETGSISGEWRLPDWLTQYRHQLKDKLLPLNIIEEYTTYHDCGKPYCIATDNDGKRHFPNHAEVSYSTWLSVGGSEQAARLMKMDMMVHTMKATDVDSFAQQPEAITLLLTGLAEVHSNAKMFGGLQSDSFKIKWNQINKRGKAICLKLFRSSYAVG